MCSELPSATLAAVAVGVPPTTIIASISRRAIKGSVVANAGATALLSLSIERFSISISMDKEDNNGHASSVDASIAWAACRPVVRASHHRFDEVFGADLYSLASARDCAATWRASRRRCGDCEWPTVLHDGSTLCATCDARLPTPSTTFSARSVGLAAIDADVIGWDNC